MVTLVKGEGTPSPPTVHGHSKTSLAGPEWCLGRCLCSNWANFPIKRFPNASLVPRKGHRRFKMPRAITPQLHMPHAPHEQTAHNSTVNLSHPTHPHTHLIGDTEQLLHEAPVASILSSGG